MKQIGLLVLFMTVALLPTTLPAQDNYDAVDSTTNSENLYFKRIGNTLQLISPKPMEDYPNAYFSLIVPDTVMCQDTMLPVVSIGRSAYKDAIGLSNITLPSTLRTIGDSAFNNCMHLVFPTLPDSLQSIGDEAFGYNYNADTVTLPSTVTFIGKGAFRECINLSSITFPDDLTFILDDLCNGCWRIKTITLPKGIVQVGARAFKGCEATTIILDSSLSFIEREAFMGNRLTKLVLPSWVLHLGPGAFAGSPNMVSISVDPGNPVYDSRDSCNAILNSSTDELMLGCSNTVIPDEATIIGSHAFYGCTKLKSYTSGENIVKIKAHAFQGCTSLQSIFILGGVDTIGDSAFLDCAQLSNVTLKHGVSHLGTSVFQNCTKLASITLPMSVTHLGGYAFAGCSKLNTVSIHTTSLTHIYPHTFQGCLLQYFDFPPHLTDIDDHAFAGCKNLTQAVFSDSLGHIGDYAFNNCSKMKIPEFPASVYEIGNRAFVGCRPYTKVTMNSIIPPVMSGPAFVSGVEIAIPCGTYTDYHSAWHLIDSTYFYNEKYYVDFNFKLEPDDKAHGVTKLITQGLHDFGCDSSAIVEAYPYDGWLFDHWSTGSTANPDTLFLDRDTTIVAYFRRDVSPTICKVSIEQDGVHVAWNEDFEVTGYKVYRMVNNAGYYELQWKTDFIELDSIIEWVDVNPPAGQDRFTYIVTAIELDGTETKLKKEQTSTHLQMKRNGFGQRVLTWTPYKGAPAGGYAVFRGTSPDDMHEIAVVSIDSSYNYTDTEAPGDEVCYYRVAAMRSLYCQNAVRPYIYSNLVYDGMDGIGDIDAASGVDIAVREGRIVVLGAEGKEVEVYDMLGRRVGHGSESPVLPQGVYVVRIGDRTVRKAVVVR